MKAKELREKKIIELKRELADKQEEVRQLRFDIVLKQEKNHRELRKLKKDIARIQTIIKELESK